ncbi:MAG: hypothetical protein AVDCRST_MAG69-2923, partial [uncultured Solirubrobacteraceae bacterium]
EAAGGAQVATPRRRFPPCRPRMAGGKGPGKDHLSKGLRPRAPRHHPDSPRTSDLRRLHAPERAGLEPRQRQHAGLPAHGRGLPRSTVGRHGRPRAARADLLRPDARRLRRCRARRRLDRRRRRRVGQAGRQRARPLRCGDRRGHPHPHPADRHGGQV